MMFRPTLKDREEKVLRVLKESDRALGANEWWYKVDEKDICSKQTFFNAKKKLIDLGFVETEKEGKKKLHFLSKIGRNFERKLKLLEEWKEVFSGSLIIAEEFNLPPKEVVEKAVRFLDIVKNWGIDWAFEIPNKYKKVRGKVIRRSFEIYIEMLKEFDSFMEKNSRVKGELFKKYGEWKESFGKELEYMKASYEELKMGGSKGNVIKKIKKESKNLSPRKKEKVKKFIEFYTGEFLQRHFGKLFNEIINDNERNE